MNYLILIGLLISATGFCAEKVSIGCKNTSDRYFNCMLDSVWADRDETNPNQYEDQKTCKLRLYKDLEKHKCIEEGKNK